MWLLALSPVYISKGPKFREPQEIDFEAAKDIITEGIETFIKTLSDNKHLALVVFDNWKFSLLDLVNKKVGKYSPSITHNKSKTIFEDPDAKIELNKLQQHFFIVLIDKAAKNISFICKQHYAQVIADELKYSSTNHIPSWRRHLWYMIRLSHPSMWLILTS